MVVDLNNLTANTHDFKDYLNVFNSDDINIDNPLQLHDINSEYYEIE
jgi:hypothetical protein